MTPTGSVIVGPSDRCNGGNLVGQRTGDAVSHATAKREAGDIDTMHVSTVVFPHKTDQIACKLHIVSITCVKARVP